MIFTPKPKQEAMISFMEDHPRCAIWAYMGTGKTVSVLTVLQRHPTSGGKTLIIAPRRVVDNVWRQEASKWCHTSALKIVALTGPPKKRLELLNKEYDIALISIELTPWLYQTKAKFDSVVIDESVALKSYRGRKDAARAYSTHKLCLHAKRVIQLSGTPIPNGLQDVYGQMLVLDNGERLGRTFGRFASNYLDSYILPGPVPIIRYKAKRDGLANVMLKIKDVVLSINNDNKRLPLVIDIPVEMSPSALKTYRKLKADYVASHDAKLITAANSACITTKLLQVANGSVYDDAGNTVIIHGAKVEALQAIVDEYPDENVIVVYHFRCDAAIIKERFHGVIPNGVEDISRWNQNKIKMLIINASSLGEGVNLQHGGRIIIFFGLWWNLKEYQQVIERIGPNRQITSGYDRDVLVFRILTNMSIDDIVVSKLEAKADMQQRLINHLESKQ